MPPIYYPRLMVGALDAALADSPVVLVHGPRQCGKTTLVRSHCEPLGYSYRTFDDAALVDAARADPRGFVAALPARTILDEVQRVPEILPALKAVVDVERTPGRFVLTGSANVLLVPRLSESLAGRMEILRLDPIAQVERARRDATILDALFAGALTISDSPPLGRDLAERIASGGFPAALARETHARRSRWYRSYVDTIVQRDVRDVARIRSLDVLPRLLEAAAGQTARLVNLTDLAGPFQVTRPTIQQYVAVLEAVFLLDTLPAWHASRMKRLVKTAKLHVVDTGLACALLGVDADDLVTDRETFGQLAETFVLQELRRQASASDANLRFHHLRDKDKDEVDIVIERGARALVGVAVKVGQTVRSSDFKGLRKLQRATGERFACGVVVYDGEACLPFGERLWALPVRRLWEGPDDAG